MSIKLVPRCWQAARYIARNSKRLSISTLTHSPFPSLGLGYSLGFFSLLVSLVSWPLFLFFSPFPSLVAEHGTHAFSHPRRCTLAVHKRRRSIRCWTVCLCICRRKKNKQRYRNHTVDSRAIWERRTCFLTGTLRRSELISSHASALSLITTYFTEVTRRRLHREKHRARPMTGGVYPGGLLLLAMIDFNNSEVLEM